MGITAEQVAKKYGVSREDQDAFAYESHQRAIRAIDKGYFKDEILPVKVQDVRVEQDKKISKEYIVDTDEGIRRDTSLEALASLKPVFALNGTVTAGNSSQTSDGAAFVVVMSEKLLQDLQIKPDARLVSCAVAGVDPLYMGIGPVRSIPKALEMAGLDISEIEQTELNEAFAAQAIAVIRESGLEHSRTNVNGGAIALGHPLGCTGTKLSIQLLNEMKRQGQKYGMVTACVGGGQGISGIFERLY